MKKVLVVDDSQVVLNVIKKTLELESDFSAVYARDSAQAQQIYEQEKGGLFAVLVDYHLPDSEEGQLIDFFLQQGLPTLVLTASFDEERREKLINKGVVDYVIKEGEFSYHYTVKLLMRLWKNQTTEVLVVEDSGTARNHIANLLKLYLFQVYTATDGAAALEVIAANPGIKMVITDYNMPNMDGFRLVQKLRTSAYNASLIIIGLSAEGEGNLTAKFIKNGANDFLRKPFNREEFQCRVFHNVESQEYLEHIQSTAHKDFLTGCYNRRYFFSKGYELYEDAKANGHLLAAAVIDIDFFKQVNDTYGHDAGDKVLKFLGNKLNKLLGRYLVARAGGEEFFILLPGVDNEQAIVILDKFRSMLSASKIVLDDQEISISFSAGVSNELAEDLDEQIKIADERLYQAKETGRNQVFGD